VAFGEVLREDLKASARHVVANAQTPAAALTAQGFDTSGKECCSCAANSPCAAIDLVASTQEISTPTRA
jgi:glycine/serine hydroxymethyltransferase